MEPRGRSRGFVEGSVGILTSDSEISAAAVEEAMPYGQAPATRVSLSRSLSLALSNRMLCNSRHPFCHNSADVHFNAERRGGGDWEGGGWSEAFRERGAREASRKGWCRAAAQASTNGAGERGLHYRPLPPPSARPPLLSLASSSSSPILAR